MKKTIFFLLFLAMATAVAAIPAIPFYGAITIDGQNASAGTIVNVFLNGTQVDTTTTPTNPGMADNEYSVTAFGGQAGDTVTIEVYDLAAHNYIWNTSDEGIPQNISFSVNTSANGIACTYDESCTSGACCSGTCQNRCSSNVVLGGGGGGGGGGSSGIQQVEEETVEPAPQTEGTFFGNFESTTEEPQENTAPTFGEPVQTVEPTQIPPPEDTGLTPAATGVFKIGDMNVTWPQLIISVLFLAALVGGGYYGYKGGKGKAKKKK